MGRPLPSNRSVASQVWFLLSKNFRITRNIELIKNIGVLFYEQNMRGNSVARILCAHDESWWVNDLMNNTHEDIKPLSFQKMCLHVTF